jgi:hypothetical protein
MTTPEFIVAVAGPVGTILVAILTWSLKRNLKSQDDTLKGIATDVSKLAGTTSAHATSLAVGNEKFRTLEGKIEAAVTRETFESWSTRVKELEQRERERLEAQLEPNHRHRRHTDLGSSG